MAEDRAKFDGKVDYDKFESLMDADLASMDAPPALPAESPSEAAPAQVAPDAPAPTPEAVPAAAEVPPPAAAPAQGSQAAPQYTPEYVNMIAKYGGRVGDQASEQAALAKAAEHYWKLNNQNAELAAKVAAGSPPAVPAPQAPPAVHPDVQRFDSRLATLDQHFQALSQAYAPLDQRYRELQKREAALVDEIAAGDIETDIVKLQKDLRGVLAQKGAVYTDMQQLQAQGRLNRESRDTIEMLKTQTEQFVALQSARQAEAEERDQATVEAYRSQWDSAAASVADAKIPKESREKFLRNVRAHAYMHLNTPGPDGQKQTIDDPQGFIAAYADEYIADIDLHHRARSSQYSQAKAADAKINAPEGAKAVAPATARPKSLAEWDALHESATF